jgi:hypothetical protein
MIKVAIFAALAFAFLAATLAELSNNNRQLVENTCTGAKCFVSP